MKHVNIADLDATVTDIPVVAERPVMTRQQKLLHWAHLVTDWAYSHRGRTSEHLVLFHGLEYLSPQQLKSYLCVEFMSSAFEIAVRDPKLNAAGLSRDATIWDLMHFMELTQEQLHEFSCDCGGNIPAERQANRITDLANGTSRPHHSSPRDHYYASAFRGPRTFHTPPFYNFFTEPRHGTDDNG
jgi:hypothetical protein